MKYLFLILVLVTTIVRSEELTNEMDSVVCNPSPTVKHKPSKAYLEKMKRLKDLEQEVVELKQKLKAEEEKNEQMNEQKQVREEKQDIKRNSLSLLGVASTTKLESSLEGTTFKANNEYQPDLGLMYQRDFNSIRATLGATIRGTFLLGAGVKF